MYLKQELSESILSATNPAATEAKHFCEVYLATGSREHGARNLKLQFAVPNHVVLVFHMCRKEDPGRWEEI